MSNCSSHHQVLLMIAMNMNQPLFRVGDAVMYRDELARVERVELNGCIIRELKSGWVAHVSCDELTPAPGFGCGVPADKSPSQPLHQQPANEIDSGQIWKPAIEPDPQPSQHPPQHPPRVAAQNQDEPSDEPT